MDISSGEIGKMVAALTAKTGVQRMTLVNARTGQTLGTSPGLIATTGDSLINQEIFFRLGRNPPA